MKESAQTQIARAILQFQMREGRDPFAMAFPRETIDRLMNELRPSLVVKEESTLPDPRYRLKFLGVFLLDSPRP